MIRAENNYKAGNGLSGGGLPVFIKVTRCARHFPVTSQPHTYPFYSLCIWSGSQKNFSGSCTSWVPIRMCECWELAVTEEPGGLCLQDWRAEVGPFGSSCWSHSWRRAQHRDGLWVPAQLVSSCSFLCVMCSSFWVSLVLSFICLLCEFLEYLYNWFPLLNFLYLSYLSWLLLFWLDCDFTKDLLSGDLKGVRRQAMWITEEREFQVEGRASAKALR